MNWLRLYSDFCERVVQNAYRDVPTKARNIVEWMVTWKLRSQGHKATGKLGDDLNTVKQLLTDPKTRANCGWTDLEYTLANKIRLVHARTHLENAVANLPLRPEFGLSVVQDLSEFAGDLEMYSFVKLTCGSSPDARKMPAPEGSPRLRSD